MWDKSTDKKISPCKNKGLFRHLAEAVRFELTEDSHPRRFSSYWDLHFTGLY